MDVRLSIEEKNVMMRKSDSSSEVLYITLALIGLLAVCVFVIAGLVLVVAKRRREAGALPLPSLTVTWGDGDLISSFTRPIYASCLAAVVWGKQRRFDIAIQYRVLFSASLSISIASRALMLRTCRLDHLSVSVSVCVCPESGRQGSLVLAGSLSRRRKTLIQNRGLRGLRSPLASSGTSVTLSM